MYNFDKYLQSPKNVRRSESDMFENLRYIASLNDDGLNACLHFASKLVFLQTFDVSGQKVDMTAPKGLYPKNVSINFAVIFVRGLP